MTKELNTFTEKQNITPYVYRWMGMSFNEINIYKMHNMGEGILS